MQKKINAELLVQKKVTNWEEIITVGFLFVLYRTCTLQYPYKWLMYKIMVDLPVYCMLDLIIVSC